MKYRTIVADPPWSYAGREGGHGLSGTYGNPARHYAVRPVEWIAALPVEALAERDAVLFLWTTNGLLPRAFNVLDAWGFRYVTTLTWRKPGLGLGRGFRTCTEHCLFGRRGALPWTGPRNVPTIFDWPRGRHSVKPEGFYDMVEQVAPPAYLELFARHQRLGWDTWGDECRRDVNLEVPA